MQTEKRKHQRIPVTIEAEKWPEPKLKSYNITLKDLSLSGMRLEIAPSLKNDEELLKIGDIVNIGFLLPTAKNYIQISSTIVWKKYELKIPQNADVTHVGVKFTAISDMLEEAISEYLSNLDEKK